MELLAASLQKELPRLGSQPETPLPERTVYVKFVDPSSNWKWYVLEFDGEGTFFGLIVNRQAVLGQFTLRELASLSFVEESGEEIRVRRDPSFRPQTLRELAGVEAPLRELLREVGARSHPDLVQLEGGDPLEGSR